MTGIFLQLAIILAAARIVGTLFRRIGQPRVCGEIAAGLVLGPSFLGGVFPEIHASIFPVDAAAGFRALSEIGLALLMFLVGVSLHLDEIRVRKGAACAISLGGIVVPFVLGLALADVLHARVAPSIDALGFRLFVATAVSITAIPTLARILEDCHLQGTRIAALTTTAAALDDVVGWTLLAAVTALVESRFSGAATVARLGGTAVFAVLMIRFVRPRFARLCSRAQDPAFFDHPGLLSAVLVATCAGAAVTSAMGLSAIFGAFIVGVTASGDARVRDALMRRLHAVVGVLFLPLFFAYTGLRTEIGTVHGWIPWMLCALVIAVAILGKIAGCGLAAASQRLSARDSWAIGILMNTRGLMELVVVNIGLDLGVINQTVFSMLVIMAVVTTYMTAPLVRRVLRHTEFGPVMEPSGFGRRAEASPLA